MKNSLVLKTVLVFLTTGSLAFADGKADAEKDMAVDVEYLASIHSCINVVNAQMKEDMEMIQVGQKTYNSLAAKPVKDEDDTYEMSLSMTVVTSSLMELDLLKSKWSRLLRNAMTAEGKQELSVACKELGVVIKN